LKFKRAKQKDDIAMSVGKKTGMDAACKHGVCVLKEGVWFRSRPWVEDEGAIRYEHKKAWRGIMEINKRPVNSLQAACFDVEAISWQQQDSIVCDTFLRLGQGLAC
jgi:hypothetical protein